MLLIISGSLKRVNYNIYPFKILSEKKKPIVIICCYLYIYCTFPAISRQEQREEDVTEGGEGLQRSAKLSGLTAQLQALRKALHHKYDQEVAALKAQHSNELRRLREEREYWEKRGERKLDQNGVDGAGSSTESLGAAGPGFLEEKLYQERVEEEVAKVVTSYFRV